SSRAPIFTSRTCSFTCSTPPSSMRAWRRASSGDRPRAPFSSSRSAAQARTSSSRSCSDFCLCTRLRQRLASRDVQIIVPSAAKGGRDGHGDAAPLLGLRLELLAPRARELVVAGAPVVVGLAPARGEPARLLHAVQGGEERARLHHEGAPGHLL